MSLATEIKEARARLGLSQSQAAKAWNIPLKTLQKWEQGIRMPQGLSLPMLRQILDAALSADKPAHPASSVSPVAPAATPEAPRLPDTP